LFLNINIITKHLFQDSLSVLKICIIIGIISCLQEILEMKESPIFQSTIEIKETKKQKNKCQLAIPIEVGHKNID